MYKEIGPEDMHDDEDTHGDEKTEINVGYVDFDEYEIPQHLDRWD